MFVRRKRCRCCNQPECTIASDDFNRADTGDLSPQWLPDSLDSFNSWHIASNKLRTGGTEIGLEFATSDPENPDDDGIRWSAVLNFAGATGRMALQVDRIDDGNYHWAEVRCTGATAANLRLWRREGGNDTALTSAITLSGFSWSADHTLALCWGLQSIIPTCSNGETGWEWVYDESIDDFTWTIVSLTGECFEGNCLQVYPAFDGSEEDNTTTTNCIPVLGTQGQPVNALKASFDGAQSVVSVAVPLGGVKVAVQMTDCSSSAAFDDAVLSRLKSGCPDCPSDGDPCQFCDDGTKATDWLVEISGVVNGVGCSLCFEFNGTYAASSSNTIATADVLCPGINQILFTCRPSLVHKVADVCFTGTDPASIGFRVSLSIGIVEDRGQPFDITRPITLQVAILSLSNTLTRIDPAFATFRLETEFAGDGSDGLPDCETEFDGVTVPFFCQNVNYDQCDFSGATVTVTPA